MRTALFIISNLISAYSFILVFRIIIFWFTGMRYGAFWNILRTITDPYLRLFHGLTFLRRGSVDLTPIPAILVLQITAMILRYLAVTAEISVVTILAAAGLAVWHTVFWLLVVLGILCAVRLISLAVTRHPTAPIWAVIDGILGRPAMAISRGIQGRRAGYASGLIVLLVVVLLLAAAGALLLAPALVSLLGVWPRV